MPSSPVKSRLLLTSACVGCVLFWSLQMQAEVSLTVRELFGSWVITRVVSMGPVTALNSSEVQLFVGRIIRYTPTELHTGKERFSIKCYLKRPLTQEDFLTENKLPARKVGIVKGPIVEISIEGAQRSVADQFGAGVYVVDKQTIVVAYRGVYFQAKRKSDQSARH